MIQTQTDSSRRYTRRGIMRRTALGVGAAATLGGAASTSAAAIQLPSRETILTAAGVAISPPAMGALYVYQRLTDTGTGSDVDSELADLNASETHASAEEDLREMASVEDRVLTSIGNVIDGLDRRSYQKGIETALNRLEAGDTQTAVKSKAVDAAHNVVAVTEKNLIDHWSIQVLKLDRLANEIENTSNLVKTDVFEVFQTDDTAYSDVAEGAATTATYTLSNGSGYSYDTTASGSGTVRGIDGGDAYIHYVKAYPSGTGGTFRPFEYYRYYNLMDQVSSIASTVETELNSWVDGIYSSYQSGDVNLSDLVTADQLAATASEQNDLSNVTADFASLGIPINDRTTLTIEIVAGENSGTIIDGNLAVKNPPTDGFIVGDTYDPANITGPVWLMYDRTTDSGETEGDVYQLKSKFKVIDAEGYDGEPVSNVTFEEKTQVRYSTDIQELKTQLDKLAEYQQEIQEERDALIEEETTAGGGGGFLSGSDQNWGLIAAGAGAVALGWGYLTGDDS